MSPYTYVVVRKDIPMHHQAVQACHAALEAGFRFEQPKEVSNLILLHVGGESELLELSRQLNNRGIQHHVFFEPDNGMGHSSLCTQALVTNRERRIFAELPMYSDKITE